MSHSFVILQIAVLALSLSGICSLAGMWIFQKLFCAVDDRTQTAVYQTELWITFNICEWNDVWNTIHIQSSFAFKIGNILCEIDISIGENVCSLSIYTFESFSNCELRVTVHSEWCYKRIFLSKKIHSVSCHFSATATKSVRKILNSYFPLQLFKWLSNQNRFSFWPRNHTPNVTLRERDARSELFSALQDGKWSNLGLNYCASNYRKINDEWGFRMN